MIEYIRDSYIIFKQDAKTQYYWILNTILNQLEDSY